MKKQTQTGEEALLEAHASMENLRQQFEKSMRQRKTLQSKNIKLQRRIDELESREIDYENKLDQLQKQLEIKDIENAELNKKLQQHFKPSDKRRLD